MKSKEETQIGTSRKTLLPRKARKVDQQLPDATRAPRKRYLKQGSDVELIKDFGD